MHAIKAMEDVAFVFEAFVSFLAAIGDLGVDSDVVVAAMAEQDTEPNVVLRCHRCHATR